MINCDTSPNAAARLRDIGMLKAGMSQVRVTEKFGVYRNTSGDATVNLEKRKTSLLLTPTYDVTPV